MTPLAFVDVETTGLDPDRHEIWEVALIQRDADGTETEHVWQLPVDLGRADPIALRIGRLHERRWTGTGHVATDDEFVSQDVITEDDMPEWAERFAHLTLGAHLVGAVVSFDEERLRRLLRRHGQCPMWHYHLVDVEALAAGTTSAPPPWDSTELSLAVGVDPEDFDRHTALGDARWAKALFDAVIGSEETQ